MKRRLCVKSAAVILAAISIFFAYQYILDQKSITWRDYMKVQDGMTLAEVEAALGPPRSIDTKPEGTKQVHWFGRKQGMIFVEFHANGTMVRKYYVEDGRDYRLSFFPQIRE